jgi:hypothetical protein
VGRAGPLAGARRASGAICGTPGRAVRAVKGRASGQAASSADTKSRRASMSRKQEAVAVRGEKQD